MATLVAALLISGCASDKEPARATTDAPSKVVIGVGGKYLANYASLWAAHEEFSKIEKKYGTTIRYEEFSKGADALYGMLGGSLQLCVISPTNGLTAAASGKDVKYVAATYVGSGLMLIGAKKHEKTYGTDIKAFKGKSLGFYGPGFTQAVAKKVLESAGLSWDDVNPVALGSGGAFAPSLGQGRVDFAVADISVAVSAINQGAAYMVSNLNDPQTGGKLVGDSLGVGMIYPGDFIKKYPNLAQDLVTGLIKGLSLVQGAGDDAAAVYALMPKEFKDVNRQESFTEQWPYLRPSFASDGGFSDSQIKGTLGLGDLDPKTLPSDYFDPTYVDEAYKSLGIQRPTN
ncbi:ABC transporter substrate-binding protein [Dactylosporangium fulvum]|uniref:ABC transporter substrate-binding protein n=1 Tax=Dactylosporangium fulvum TaxID=53359 RepID=A0ABY5W640_9ACTN|nr:ABC transporter substrate-binding protein [Dactylosporangium fulvum]UWP85537.1 ABC transporter substrate-binding protein [Dactylosporangium fulvum]